MLVPGTTHRQTYPLPSVSAQSSKSQVGAAASRAEWATPQPTYGRPLPARLILGAKGGQLLLAGLPVGMVGQEDSQQVLIQAVWPWESCFTALSISFCIGSLPGPGSTPGCPGMCSAGASDHIEAPSG